ncbi:hypothetical protein [Microbispora siamensis]|uniref:Helix-turn-helix domain-containing protein n=1 Tax=Microbispora siamensis TaxID=564413 RepID=A0ABQ4GRD3_9ACTN|nr:hypothetical protein [Microbispora siamensis]GIH63987.1 hypothetical protein Msi02_48040 [Microbispora siamensis]
MAADDWLSLPGVLWAINAAPDVPASALATLIGLAKHTDENGLGAYPSKDHLAWYARKSPKQVKRDLEVLLQRDLIRLGDQNLTKHLRGDKRPTVYDLAMERKRPAYESPASTGGHVRPPVTPESADNPDERGVMYDPPQSERGVMYVRAGGHVRPSGGSCTTPEESSNNPRKISSSSVSAPDAPHGHEEEDEIVKGETTNNPTGPVVDLPTERAARHIVDRQIGIDRDQARAIVALIDKEAADRKQPVKTWTRYVLRISDDELRDYLGRVQAASEPSKPARREMPDWCGECDDHDRTRENDQGQVYYCPRCNPLSHRYTAVGVAQ